jgi:hypothetical protein
LICPANRCTPESKLPSLSITVSVESCVSDKLHGTHRDVEATGTRPDFSVTLDRGVSYFGELSGIESVLF